MPPLVIDFPHSGLEKPDDWNTVLAPEQWMRSADLYVDELWTSFQALGIPAVKASFPRVYLDVNRASTDFCPEHFIQDIELPTNPSRYATLGMGLAWITCGPENFHIYDTPPSLSELKNRLDNFYWPYHNTLQYYLNAADEYYGGYVFLDLHSMPAVGDHRSLRALGEGRPDCIIGTLDGRSAHADLTDYLAGLFIDQGFKTSVNEEFKGGYLVSRYGEPSRNHHALQVELNRGLYLMEDRISKNQAFPAVQKKLGWILQSFYEYTQKYFL